MMSHPIVHIELSSINHKEAAKFYADVFGWEMSDFAEMHYTTFLSGENAPGGGFNDVQEGNPAGTTVVYIHTDSIETKPILNQSCFTHSTILFATNI